MKKILIITQNFYPEIGSASNRMKNIYLELTGMGYEVTVLTSDPSYPNRNLYKDSQFWDEEEVHTEDIVRVKPRTKKYTRNIVNRLLLYIEVAIRLMLAIVGLHKRYDYIFVSTPPIFVGIAGLFAKWKLRAKLILDVRDLWPESLLGVGVFNHHWILKAAYKLEAYLYRSADHIIINSKGFLSYLLEKGREERTISFMPNSLTEQELQMNVEPVENGRINVIYTGNIGLAQDILKLIDVAQLLQPYTHIHFTIIGYGYRKADVQTIIKEKNLSNITIMRPTSRRNTLKQVASAHIAYVSLVEKDVFDTVLPGKVIDYMCMKKPIIGDVSGYAQRVLEEAGCGLVAKERTADEISRLILELAENQSLRKQLGDNGYRYAFQSWRWKENIKVLVKAMEE